MTAEEWAQDVFAACDHFQRGGVCAACVAAAIRAAQEDAEERALAAERRADEERSLKIRQYERAQDLSVKLIEAERERDEAYATNKRLNRRAQLAESAIRERLAQPTDPRGFGRILANAAAVMYLDRAESAERAREEAERRERETDDALDRMTGRADDYWKALREVKSHLDALMTEPVYGPALGAVIGQVLAASQKIEAALAPREACDDHRPDGPDPVPNCGCASIDRLCARATERAARCLSCGDIYEDQPHGQHCGASLCTRCPSCGGGNVTETVESGHVTYRCPDCNLLAGHSTSAPAPGIRSLKSITSEP